MGFLEVSRVPEPEIMAAEEEAEAYASATALRHLEALDDSFVDQALQLGVERGMVLDLGTGPGQIPIKLAVRNPSLIIHAIDLSDAMLRRAAMDATRWGVEMRILFNHGDVKSTGYDSGLFDLVMQLRLASCPRPGSADSRNGSRLQALRSPSPSRPAPAEPSDLPLSRPQARPQL